MSRAGAPPRISLVVSTYNQTEALDGVLDRVLRLSVPPAEILVADDGSGPATASLLKAWRPRAPLRLEHLWQEDHGFRKTRILNRALAAATGDYVVFLDGDCLPAPRFIEDHGRLAEPGCFVQGRRAFVKEQHVGALLAGRTTLRKLMLGGGVQGLAKALRFPAPWVRRNRSQRGLIGCNLGVWRADLVRVNGFDEEFVGWGGEDSDLGTRLYHLGLMRKMVYGRALVYHLNHPRRSAGYAPGNLERLRRTQESGRVRCERGLDLHLPESP